MDDVHTVPEAPEPEVPEVHEAPANPEALDDNYLDFTLPSLDDHADRLREHPAWPWVCWDGVSGDGDVEVDYWALSMG